MNGWDKIIVCGFIFGIANLVFEHGMFATIASLATLAFVFWAFCGFKWPSN